MEQTGWKYKDNTVLMTPEIAEDLQQNTICHWQQKYSPEFI